MELILMILLPFPIGFFIKNRLAAFVTYIAVHSFIFTLQSVALVLDWVKGGRSAFGDDGLVWEYGAVNLVIFGVGLGLVALGHRVGRGRRAKSPAVDLAV